MGITGIKVSITFTDWQEPIEVVQKKTAAYVTAIYKQNY